MSVEFEVEVSGDVNLPWAGSLAAVIDDVKVDRDILQRRAERLGFVVEAVDDPRNLSRAGYSLALVDMEYEGRFLGGDYCEYIRSTWPQCLILAVSSVGEAEGYFMDAVERGACVSMEKTNLTVTKLRELMDHYCCNDQLRPCRRMCVGTIS